jgi:mycofactocin biosynthetic radical S-adenosylmethionine protein MftC
MVTVPHSQPIDRHPVLVYQHFGCTVFDRCTSRYYPFDHDATNLLRALSETTIERLAATVPAHEVAALWRFYERFYALGFFTLDGRFAGVVLDNYVPPHHLAGPLAVHLEVVAACNLKCSHCFAGTLPRHDAPLTMQELDRLFATLASMGSFRLGLTGGEPTLRHDLFEIIDLATSHGLHPCLTTNGLTLTEETAREFGKRPMVWLNVSLDGATAETNDRVRGAGTFDRVMDRLQVLAQHTTFTLAFTIMRSNVHEIRACAALAERVGAGTAVFRPMYPAGVALHHLHLMPDFADYHHAIEQLAAYGAESAAQLRAIDPFSPVTRAETQSVVHSDHGCGAGTTVCSISVSGTVNPCSFLGDAFNATTIRDMPFDEIWHRSQTFREMRALEGGSPETFSGGCRARALVFNGSANAPDPWMRDRDRASRHADGAEIHDPMDIIRIEVASPGGL